MKLYPAFLVAAFIISDTVGFAQSNVGLVAQWTFNNNVNDSTGNGHNGTAHGVTKAAGLTGKANTAYYFNGTNSYISTPYAADLNLTNYSLCAIIKPMGYYAGTCQRNDIICRGTEGNAGNYTLQFTDHPYDNSCNVVDTPHNCFVLPTAAINTSGSQAGWQYTPTISSGTWYTVVGTFDGGTCKVYVNGELKSAFPTTGSLIGTSTEGLYLGSNVANTGSFPNWFKGYIDDARVYNRVLNDTEIRQYATRIYMLTKDTICPGRPFPKTAYIINGDYLQTPGTVFTLEMSDLAGTFYTPTVLGTYTVPSWGGVADHVSIPCYADPTLQPGLYKLRVTTNRLALVSETIDFYVQALEPSPKVSVTSSAGSTKAPWGTTVTFTATSLNAGANPVYKWFRNKTFIPGPTSATYSAIAGIDFMDGDQISAMVKSPGCALVDSVTGSTYIAVGVGNVDADHNFNVYPNPNKGTFALKGFVNNNSVVKMEVTSAIGQVVYSGSIMPVNRRINEEVSLAEISNGVYFVKLQSDGITETLRLAVQR